MLYKLLFLFISLLISFPSISQVSISGKVLDGQQNSIPGATVSLAHDETNLGTTTDLNGSFSITLSDTGVYALEVRFLGYNTYQKSYEFLQNQSYDLGAIVLTEHSRKLQTVEVLGRLQRDYNSAYSFSATKIAIENKELPQSMSTITKELMADRQAFQLADAVEMVSGVAPSSYYNQYNIRGISQNEEGQILNGMRTRQYYFLQPITSHIERVEVLKGPASVTFSTVDPGGSINMVTKKPLAEDRKEISMSVGSFSTIRGTLDFTGPLNESKTLLYRINGAVQEGKSFRDLVSNDAVLFTPSISYTPTDKTAINVEMIYSNSTGTLDRGQPIFGATAGETDLNSTPISLNLGATNDYFNSQEFIIMTNLAHKLTNNISFNAAYMKQSWKEDLQEHRTTNAFAVDLDNQAVTSLADMRFVQRQQFWNTDNLSAYFNIDFNLGQVSNKLLVGYDLSSWHKTKGGGQNSARGYLLTDGTVARSFDLENIDAYQTITYGDRTLPKQNVEHFDLNNPQYTIKNVEDYVLDSRIAVPSAFTTTHAIYVQELLKFGKLSALLSLRQEWFEDITNYDAPGEAAFTNTALIPRVGLTYELNNQINVYATYLEGYQPQSNTVTLMPSTGAFFWDPNSPARFEPLISDLKEVGAKGEFFEGSVMMNVALYEINQKNILINANLPAFPDSLVQRGADRSRGFEWELAGYLIPDWQINVSYSYIDARIIEDQDESLNGERKENTPLNSANIWTRYDFSGASFLQDLGIGLGLQYSGSKVPWFTREFTVPGYTLMDMALYYQPSKTNMQLALNVNNVLNTTYWIGAQNYLRLFPGAPRNFILTATYRF
ncbi:iron complex outermembrane receptor protein [Catalinimonas alkaloidigena]|uniref:TonB-dependent receptor n=1 Tax=Catalinimonas alkaloidigena TaxID=1075417 RepID=UPI0024049CEB|nr:TonB-dependent receptor [Catalinimonas alkaloidigena]MDF9797847.1 iron complex outermembrane receptor protein [Catalinimonas alkaloidigena]